MKPKTPPGLSREAGALWRRMQAEYGIGDSGGMEILTRACEALDRIRSAQAVINKAGILVFGANKIPKANPATQIERDARSAFLQAMKQLNLDLEPLKAIGRPPA